MTKLKPHKNTHRTGVLYSFPRYPTLKKHHDSLTATFSSRNRCAESPFAKFWRPKKTGRLTREKLVVLKGDQSWISFFWCSKFGLFSGEILLKLLVFFFCEGFLHPKNTKQTNQPQPFKRKIPARPCWLPHRCCKTGKGRLGRPSIQEYRGESGGGPYSKNHEHRFFFGEI